MLKEAYGVRRRVAVTWPTLDGRPSSLLVGPGAAVARTGTGPGRVRYEAASAELEVSRIERALVDTEPARCARASDQNLGDVARDPSPERGLQDRSFALACAEEARTVLATATELEMGIAQDSGADRPTRRAALELLPHPMRHQICRQPGVRSYAGVPRMVLRPQ